MTTTWNKQWNALGSDEKRTIARSAGFSESESALLSKLYWEGFPVFIITQLQSVKWAEQRCPTCGSTNREILGTQLAYISYEQGSSNVPCRHEWHKAADVCEVNSMSEKLCLVCGNLEAHWCHWPNVPAESYVVPVQTKPSDFHKFQESNTEGVNPCKSYTP